ncbi:MAG TPA: serine/threonine-protein kinase [Candidatus Eremiobacteraeota bacterium]|nr:MAG: Serine/threonine-protein kinase C [bacterium ADurb.Bin363]HPZ07751.1 serine/threonine-protein kinase [Candidatus Eremiobacteraeota bacterium]
MAIICNNCGEENFDLATQCSICGGQLYYTDALIDGTLLQDRYRIEKLIKFGGMGAIYLASDDRLNRYCVVKEMLTTYGSRDEKHYAEKRFNIEARLLSQLEHYHLPTVYDYFIEKGRYYLVMSYIEGVDLFDVLQLEGKPGLPEEIVIEWALQILDVLHYLHTQIPPIVYRDIKPSNIMLHKDGRVVLIDFGIARTIQPGKNLKYTAVGTDGYAAEEQFRGEVEPRSDLYSLGATMHHLLTGKTPSAFNIKPVRNLAPWVSPQLEYVIMKALEFEAPRRYASAMEMKEALCSIINQGVKSRDVQKRIPFVIKSVVSGSQKKKPVPYDTIKDKIPEEEKAEILKSLDLDPQERRSILKPSGSLENKESWIFEKRGSLFKPRKTKLNKQPVPQENRPSKSLLTDKIKDYCDYKNEELGKSRLTERTREEIISEEILDKGVGAALTELLKAKLNGTDENNSKLLKLDARQSSGEPGLKEK